jgi:hypothetical protein
MSRFSRVRTSRHRKFAGSRQTKNKSLGPFNEEAHQNCYANRTGIPGMLHEAQRDEGNKEAAPITLLLQSNEEHKNWGGRAVNYSLISLFAGGRGL